MRIDGQTREGRLAAVIWRETEGWQKADLERNKKFVAERKLTEGVDEVFVNGNSFIPNAGYGATGTTMHS